MRFTHNFIARAGFFGLRIKGVWITFGREEGNKEMGSPPARG